jgi:hypothetical protein
VHAHIIASTNGASGNDNSHDTALAFHSAAFRAPKNFAQKPWLEAVDLLAGVSESRDTHDCVVTEVQQGIRREREQVDASRRNILAQLPCRHLISRGRHFIKKLGMDQVHLPQIRLCWIPGNPGSVLDSHAGMSVALDAPARDQNNFVDDGFAETVVRISAHGDDGPDLVVQGHATILAHTYASTESGMPASRGRVATVKWLLRLIGDTP